MGNDEIMWRSAAEDAALTGEEEALLMEACERDPQLATELTFLVGHLSANLGGAFLRSLVDHLGRDHGGDPGTSVLAALHETVLGGDASARSHGGML